MFTKSVFGVAIAACLLASCKKDPVISETTVRHIVDVEDVAMRGLGEFTMDGVESRITVSVDGYMNNGDCRMGSFSASAVFNERMDAAGKVFVENLPLLKIEEEGKFRYLLATSMAGDFFPPDFDPEEISRSGEVDIRFESEMPEKYGSFSGTFTIPHPLCLEVAFSHGYEHSKSEDLTFTWEPDDRCDYVYAALCAPGAPCIFKQFEDAAGSGTIAASEFADFPVGKDAWLFVGRGMGSVVEYSNGQKIGVLRYLYMLGTATMVP
ncbi:MAG: hypothetical protein D6694_07535 [Gammaproteobacteria bacterium]|nr:MAG: hypothetical protein D6694_07535 [Gammaproteobacteria bacterium]